MLWSIFRRWRLPEHPLKEPSDDAWQHLADLYRVAFYLIGDQGIAEELIESVYACPCRNRGALPNGQRLKEEMLRFLLSRAERIPPIHSKADQSIELASLSKLPYRLRMPLVLDAIGMDANEIASLTGLGVLEVIARQRIGWDLFAEAFSEQSPPDVSSNPGAFQCFRHSVTSC